MATALSAIAGLSPLWCFGLLVLAVFVKLIHYTTFRDFNPSKLPVHGVSPGIFGRILAIPSVYLKSFDLYDKGHAKYHAHGESPTAFLAPYQLVGYVHCLPPTLVNELKTIPESVFSLGDAFNDDLSLTTIFGSEYLLSHPYHVGLIRYKLTASLPKIYGNLDEEVIYSFKEVWDRKYFTPDAQGKQKVDEDGWVGLNISDTLMEVISRVSNRVFSGTELCRNEVFLKNILECIMNLIFSGMGLSIFPLSLQPVVAPLFTFNFKRKLRAAVKILEPVIRERVRLYENRLNDAAEKSKEPDDMLQYVIEEASRQGPEHYTLKDISIRYVLINLASIHSTATTTAWCILHCAGHTPTTGGTYWETLHQEIRAVDKDSEEEAGIWTKRKLNKLVGLDSFLRESLGHSMASTVGMLRKCKQKGGYTFSNGLWIKEGEIVGVAAEAIQRHTRFASEGADGFDGFRFSRPYQELDPSSVTGAIDQNSAVTTANDFLPFGHGKHACPGRFFAVDEVKTMMRCMIENYELKPMDSIPALGYFKGNTIPPLGVNVQFRRRTAL